MGRPGVKSPDDLGESLEEELGREPTHVVVYRAVGYLLPWEVAHPQTPRVHGSVRVEQNSRSRRTIVSEVAPGTGRVHMVAHLCLRVGAKKESQFLYSVFHAGCSLPGEEGEHRCGVDCTGLPTFGDRYPTPDPATH